MRTAHISSSHYPTIKDLRGEVDFNNLRCLSWSLGHDRHNQDYGVFLITTSFPEEASSFWKLHQSELQLGMCCSTDTTPQSLLEFQGPNE